MEHKITPDETFVGTHRTGTIRNTTATRISEILGFEPNREDDPDKVVNSWQARVGDKIIAVWDYKGSHRHGQFSTYGDSKILSELFGESYKKDSW